MPILQQISGDKQQKPSLRPLVQLARRALADEVALLIPSINPLSASGASSFGASGYAFDTSHPAARSKLGASEAIVLISPFEATPRQDSDRADVTPPAATIC
jgi:hypothetical protein